MNDPRADLSERLIALAKATDNPAVCKLCLDAQAQILHPVPDLNLSTDWRSACRTGEEQVL